MYHSNLNLKQSQKFIEEHHRHSKPLKRHIFSIGAFQYPVSFGVVLPSEVLGVVTVDRCSSAWSKRRDHVEIRRLCVKPDVKKNVSSFLIGKARDACFAMGYKCIITYTKPNESGASLLATGFVIQKVSRGLVQWCLAEGWCVAHPRSRAFTKRVIKQLRALNEEKEK